ncbi:4Fe-4S binding protein [Devosia sp. 2618]|uniref:4Fe-4S binding protein n=1 Tax=Devosia sp. 2618 TaxID=3156454 RepID=UPI00339A1762
MFSPKGQVAPLAAFFVRAILCLWFLSASFANAVEYDYVENTPALAERVTPEVLRAVFPGADRIEILDDGGPPAAAAYQGDAVVGYVFSTLDVVRAHGYSGTPFDVVAGVNLEGQITGAVSLFHREPLIIEDERLTNLTQKFMVATAGMSSRTGASDGPKPEFIAGATTSGRAFRNAIRDSARMVLSARLGRPVIIEPTLDIDSYIPTSLDALLEDGSITTMTVTNADLAQVMQQAGAAMPEIPPTGGPDDTYLQLYTGLATPAMIGRNVVRRGSHDLIFADYPKGTQAIFLSSNGRYDFLGYAFQNQSSGGHLERLRIRQGDLTFEFDKTRFMRAQSPFGKVSGLVLLPPDSGFDPLEPWRVEILVRARDATGATTTVVLPPLDYSLPAKHILMPEPDPVPAWVEAWEQSRNEVLILGLALTILTAIFALQPFLTRHRILHRWVRNGFLVFTLVWLGWGVGAQLSIVHVINYLKAPFQNLDIGFYLAEPLIVMISVYVAISLVLIGRGVFCGWLCPFGALQELLAQTARLLRLPQWNPSAKLQSKLWWGKYASFVLVVGLAFLAPTAGSVAADIEPFKTAISTHFVRALPYVLYAVVLLSIGLFTERAFCRFLCPLGGALAILDRLHLLTLLKRRPECGSPCKLCERSCPVRAIEPSGKINMAECFQCLDCQVEYYDDHRCPPLAKQRKLRERSAVAQGPNVPVFTRSAVAK